MSCQNFKAKNVNCQGEEILDKNKNNVGIISITFTYYPFYEEKESLKKLREKKQFTRL